MITGTVHCSSTRSTLFSSSTLSAPLMCQKSPRKTMPAPRFLASSCTVRSTCSHVSIEELRTCRSEKSSHLPQSLCLWGASIARSSNGGSGAAGVGTDSTACGILEGTLEPIFSLGLSEYALGSTATSLKPSMPSRLRPPPTEPTSPIGCMFDDRTLITALSAAPESCTFHHPPFDRSTNTPLQR